MTKTLWKAITVWLRSATLSYWDSGAGEFCETLQNTSGEMLPAEVLPIFKKKNSFDKENYRPAIILSFMPKILWKLNPFMTNVSILCPLKTLENQRLSGVFRRYKMEILTKNGSLHKKLMTTRVINCRY